MKACLILAAALLIVTINVVRSNENDFETFKTKQSKSYATPTEAVKRKAIFESNVNKIASLNAESEKRKEGVVHGVNQFTDYTSSEFIQMFTGFKPGSSPFKVVQAEESPSRVSAAAAVTSFDWTINKTGIVAPVKNQGQCGSCWAFSAVGVLESYYARVSKTSVTQLSEEQVKDCDTQNSGCNGGFPATALSFLSKNGAALGTSYPYVAKAASCKSYSVFLKPNYFLPKNILQLTSEALMMTYLQSNGPISVCIDATVLQTYKTGVISTCSKNINHAIILVGFGTDSSSKQNFWRLKNSWGASWGEAGYFRLLRDKDTCGITKYAYYLS